MKHAEKLIDRILFLEGVPEIARYDVIRVGTDVKEQFENDLKLEMGGVKHYNDAVDLCMKLKDNGTRELLEPILTESEEHVDWLETQLGPDRADRPAELSLRTNGARTRRRIRAVLARAYALSSRWQTMHPSPAPVWQRMSLRVRISHVASNSIRSASVTWRQRQTIRSEARTRASGREERFIKTSKRRIPPGSPVGRSRVRPWQEEKPRASPDEPGRNHGSINCPVRGTALAAGKFASARLERLVVSKAPI